MDELDCQKLTLDIQKMATLLSQVDSALSNFKAEKGIEARHETNEIFARFVLEKTGIKNSLALLEKVGGMNELMKRCDSFVQTEEDYWLFFGRINRREIEITIAASEEIQRIMDDLGQRFQEKVVQTVRLSLREIGLDESTPAEIFAKAAEFGLTVCSPEFPPFYVGKKYEDEASLDYRFAMDYQIDEDFSGIIAVNESNKVFMDVDLTEDRDSFGANVQFVFCIEKNPSEQGVSK
jgi:hypothetical protein